MRTKILFLLLLFIISIIYPQQGKYFGRKAYIPVDLPTYITSRDKLPEPVLEGNPEWVEMYHKCWEIAFDGLKQPPEGSPLVSNWLDEAFSENIFQWDTIFMIMFARYGNAAFPAIESLDNFYALQFESGFIGREFREKDGKLIHFDFDGGLFSPKGWKNMINPPLFSWAEVESYKLTGDKSRFRMVLPVLEKYAEWLNRDGDPDAADWQNNGRISKTTEHKLYWNTPLGSGMDNTPRPAEKGAGWVEMSAQMVIMYNNLAVICEELGEKEKADNYRNEAEQIGRRINKWCWNEEDGFYYDVKADGTQFRKKTSGGFWTLLAGVASEKQAERLVAHLKNKNEFWRLIPFPALSADEEEYHPRGDYWKGGVWAPTNVMIIKGLEQYGYNNFASEAAGKYIKGIYEVYKDSGTVYENYAPDYFSPGFPSKPDFVGWTGCGPIQLLIENVIGIDPDGANNSITWSINRKDRHGVKNISVGSNKISIVCSAENSQQDKRIITVECTEPFNLTIIRNGNEKIFRIKKGKAELGI